MFGASVVGVVPQAIGLPATAPIVGGEAHYESTSGRYQFPTLGPIRLLGTVVVGGEAFTGRIDGTRAVLDPATVTYPGIELASSDGHLSGTCTAVSRGLPGQLAGEEVTFDCSVRLGGGTATAVTFVVRAVGHRTTGDPLYGTQTTTSDGAFTTR